MASTDSIVYMSYRDSFVSDTETRVSSDPYSDLLGYLGEPDFSSGSGDYYSLHLVLSHAPYLIVPISSTASTDSGSSLWWESVTFLPRNFGDSPWGSGGESASVFFSVPSDSHSSNLHMGGVSLRL